MRSMTRFDDALGDALDDALGDALDDALGDALDDALDGALDDDAVAERAARLAPGTSRSFEVRCWIAIAPPNLRTAPGTRRSCRWWAPLGRLTATR